MFVVCAVRSRTLLQVQDDYAADPEPDVPEGMQFTLNNSDYLKAAAPALTSQSTVSHEVTVEVAEIERRGHEHKMKTEKR